ncbi:Signal peptidase I T [Candidatus Rhabdochlamydia sp. T3358]|nr:Signal peptidase I T [Candidatus Rhabdochlamydia sp. T3358]
MWVFSKKKMYSLRKSKHYLIQTYHLYKKKKYKLPVDTRIEIEASLTALQNAILQKDRPLADRLAKEAQGFGLTCLKKGSFDYFRDVVIGVFIALIIALLIRQMWFELYEIPSGSMRPTFKEKDRLIVSKTDFGINIPLKTKHLYFDPDLIKRNSIVIFTGENMDIYDVDTMYFYLFPGKKQYIKRLIGKPGDTLYFYGGQIYGIDKDGKDITQELQLTSLKQIEHIPFINFQRKVELSHKNNNSLIFYQMNEPVAEFNLQKNQAKMLSSVSDFITDYSDLWGFKNFGMARLLNSEELKEFHLKEVPKGVLYLEIKHHPSLQSVQLTKDEYKNVYPKIQLSTSIIALQESHLKALMQNLYTARFVVKNHQVCRYPDTCVGKKAFAPVLAGIPDGCYEFYHGKAYRILWQGMNQELPPSHPLYAYSPQNVQLLFNLGIDWDNRFLKQKKEQRLVPARYAYFRNQDFYLMGAPILKHDDPSLVEFVRKESSSPTPFMDYGPPLLKNGVLDVEFIKKYGLTIPLKMYLVLGDNHAMSSDSRDFGFVPEDNLKGSPSWIFWPPGSRWGRPNQPLYPWLNLPNLIVYSCGAIGLVFCLYRWIQKNKLPIL